MENTFISNITLALFEDSGWYKVDYTKAQAVPWGKDKGCEFLEAKCINKKKIKKSFLTFASNDPMSKLSTYDSVYHDEFCTNFDEEKCSISHTFELYVELRNLNLQYLRNINILITQT